MFLLSALGRSNGRNISTLLLTSILILLMALATTVFQISFAMHDSNLDVNTWLKRDNSTATTIDLNNGPTTSEGEITPEGAGDEEQDTGDEETSDEENGGGEEEDNNAEDQEE